MQPETVTGTVFISLEDETGKRQVVVSTLTAPKLADFDAAAGAAVCEVDPGFSTNQPIFDGRSAPRLASSGGFSLVAALRFTGLNCGCAAVTASWT